MPRAGVETLALWREAGEWWAERPQREIHRFIDHRGVRREELIELPPDDPEPDDEAIVANIQRTHRLREDKVARACSSFPLADLGGLGHKARGGNCAALHTLSGYSFGRSIMFASSIPVLAAVRGYTAALLADSFSLSGAFEFQGAADDIGIRSLIGATFEMDEGGEIVLVARNRTGYRSLSRLITDCHLDEPRLFPLCNWQRLETHSEGLNCLTGGDNGPLNRAVVRNDEAAAIRLLERLISLYGREHVFIEIERTALPWQIAANRRLLDLAEKAKVVPVAGGPILHSRKDDFPAQDVSVCIDSLCLIDEVVGRKPRRHPSQPSVIDPPRRGLNAERALRRVDELLRLYSDRLDLLASTMRMAEQCEANVLPPHSELPAFCDNEAETLREITQAGAKSRYSNLDRKIRDRIRYELKTITGLGYATHFLIAWDMCNWARSQGILFSGRGSVVDSIVAYCLGLSRIDAYEHNLFFDRFLPADGSKRPDIDIDFEARRRDDVRNYLAGRYGERHVATVAAIGTFCSRGIVRELGKVMGIPPDSLSYLAKRIHGSVSPYDLEREIDLKPELRNSGIPKERYRWIFKLAKSLANLPRNIRSHSSGVVISRDPIPDTVPMTYSGIEDVKIIQWDKRSAKKCFDKFDVLCLRGNDVLSDTQRRTRTVQPDFQVEEISLEDEEVFRAMRAGQLIGVPQSASPAMRQAHIRIQTRNFRDAGIIQAAIRPGVGGAVKLNEYVSRRKGKEYSFKHQHFQEILGDTYGIVVFQEQIDQLLQTFGGYSPDDAEEIRERIHRYRHERYAETIKDEMIGRVVERGYSREVAEEAYELVAGFQGYGFAQGHALAFADISIRSIWCQQNHPSEYFAALLDAQPAGYYGPCTLANEARVRGVKILQPDIERSELTFSVEDVRSDQEPKLVLPNGGVRVSLRQIAGLSKQTCERIVSERESGPYRSFFDAVARVRPDRDELETLILCGAFDRFERNRRALLWAIPSALEHANLLEATREALPITLIEPTVPQGVEPFDPVQEAIHERAILSLDVERHLMAFERDRIRARGGVTAAEASRLPDRSKAFVVGNPIRLRFPPTSSGKRVMFFDLEDETGLLNVTCFDDTYQRYGHTVICSQYVTLWGTSQDRDGHIAFLVHRIIPFRPTVNLGKGAEGTLPVVTADFLVG